LNYENTTSGSVVRLRNGRKRKIGQQVNERRIPFFGEKRSGIQGYTLFINPNTKEVFMADHKEVNMAKYWILFALTLALIRSFLDKSLSFNNQFNVIIVILLSCVIGVLMGRSMYQSSYINDRQIYITHEELKDFIREGNLFYKRQIIMMSIFILLACSCLILFIVSYMLIWLVGIFVFSLLFGTVIPLLSRTRYLLYKDKNYFDIE